MRYLSGAILNQRVVNMGSCWECGNFFRPGRLCKLDSHIMHPTDTCAQYKGNEVTDNVVITGGLVPVEPDEEVKYRGKCKDCNSFTAGYCDTHETKVPRDGSCEYYECGPRR